jgi:DNA repair exonuclease SbcCD ATPase subunit
MNNDSKGGVDTLRWALADLRAGTEVLRTGGGAHLSVSKCNALLDEIERLTEEREQLLKQRWSKENRAEVAERGHKAALARDFEQRDTIKVLRAEVERLTGERNEEKERHRETADFAEQMMRAKQDAYAEVERLSGESDEWKKHNSIAEAELRKADAEVERLYKENNRLSGLVDGVQRWFQTKPWRGDPDPGSFGGHTYSPNERAIGYGTYRDPRFLPAALAGLREVGESDA